MEDDDDLLQSEAKQLNGWQKGDDGEAAPGVQNGDCCSCKRDYEKKCLSLNKQLEILYHEVQRLVQVVKVSKATV